MIRAIMIIGLTINYRHLYLLVEDKSLIDWVDWVEPTQNHEHFNSKLAYSIDGRQGVIAT